MSAKRLFEPHLVMKEITLPPGAEWQPDLPGWVFAQVTKGQAYSIHALRNQQLDSGAVIGFARSGRACIRASQVNGALLNCFHVEPERLVGLITLGEQQSLQQAGKWENEPPRVFHPNHPVSEKFKKVCSVPTSHHFSERLHLLEIFTEILADELKSAPEEPSTTNGARTRMADLLRDMPAEALLDLKLDELVQQMHCTPRHVSRVFNEVVGTCFRKKQSEVRLMRAQELLATTDTKVVEVAMESGFQSVSLFNLMFKRRFGSTPGEWRERVKKDVKRPSTRRLLPRA
jgi:AraC-like DNA-binding protein